MWAALVVLAIGLAWRLARYLLQFPIWGDEAFILVDIYDRDYARLTDTLSYWQVAPILFLWGQKLALNLFGTSELSVHLLPFAASTLALLLFADVARRSLTPLHAALAVGVLAVSYYPVRHGCEAKPYAFDLLMSVVLCTGALGWLREPGRCGWLILLTLAVPVAMCSSYPAAFVAGAVSLALLPGMRSASWKGRLWYAAYNIAMLAAFLGHFLTVGHNQIAVPQAQNTNECLHQYWRDSFPPHSLARLPFWLLETHTGGLLAYPVGGPAGVSTGSLILCILGGWYLWRRGQRSLLALCILPFGLTLFAACLGKYPYGGSARIAQHLAPMACMLIGAGGVWLLERLRSPALRMRWACAVCFLLAVLGVVGIARDWRKPYKTDYDRAMRELAASFWTQVQPDERVVICNPPIEVIANFHWYLCRTHADVVWAGNDRPSLSSEGAWLLKFALAPVPATELTARVGQESGWTVADYAHFTLPKEAPGDATIIWTKLHLRPGGHDGHVAPAVFVP
jgi:hypothetical protein